MAEPVVAELSGLGTVQVRNSAYIPPQPCINPARIKCFLYVVAVINLGGNQSLINACAQQLACFIGWYYVALDHIAPIANLPLISSNKIIVWPF